MLNALHEAIVEDNIAYWAINLSEPLDGKTKKTAELTAVVDTTMLKDPTGLATDSR